MNAEGQRAAFLTGAVEHVLQHGVATLSLRPLAAALGTSDRMLLYYFGTREKLLVAVLEAVGRQLQDGLDAALPPRSVGPGALLRQAWDALCVPGTEAHLRLYLEVSGLAARGREPFATMAAGVAQAWLAWTAARLDVPEDRRATTAAGVLATIDGLLLLRFVASADVAELAMSFFDEQLDR